jgi:hypothetical protein
MQPEESIKLQQAAPKQDFLRSVYDDFEVNKEDMPEFYPAESANQDQDYYPTLQASQGDFESDMNAELEEE